MNDSMKVDNIQSFKNFLFAPRKVQFARQGGESVRFSKNFLRSNLKTDGQVRHNDEFGSGGVYKKNSYVQTNVINRSYLYKNKNPTSEHNNILNNKKHIYISCTP